MTLTEVPAGHVLLGINSTRSLEQAAGITNVGVGHYRRDLDGGHDYYVVPAAAVPELLKLRSVVRANMPECGIAPRVRVSQ